MKTHDHNCSCDVCWPTNYAQTPKSDEQPTIGLINNTVPRMMSKLYDILREE